MKRTVVIVVLFSLLLAACGSTTPPCIDPLGCVTVGNNQPITIAVELTLSGPNAAYGIDALRGVELAIADQGKVLNHPIQLMQEDDLCSVEGGKAAAEKIVQNKDVVGVIGATCSGASEAAAKVVSDAGLVLISPSSTAASLTSPTGHQSGFLRTIYNDESQAQVVADFAFTALGARTMAAINDGSAYSVGLQEATCKVFEGLGGKCTTKVAIDAHTDVGASVLAISQLKPDVLYLPVYTDDGVRITSEVLRSGLTNIAILGSDGLLNADFASKAKNAGGVYVSGPSTQQIDPTFGDKYEASFGEKPVAVYSEQAYDAAMMLFHAIETVVKTTGRDILIPRTSLRAALYATKNYKGVSGTLTCNPQGDCATPAIVIYELDSTRNFKAIYP